jgi:hypothetical protein
MEKNIFKKLSDEKLVNRRDLVKGASIGLGISVLIALAILIYLFFSYRFTDLNLILFIPFFGLPVTFMPLMISLSLLNKEIKSRNIE